MGTNQKKIKSKDYEKYLLIMVTVYSFLFKSGIHEKKPKCVSGTLLNVVLFSFF